MILINRECIKRLSSNSLVAVALTKINVFGQQLGPTMTKMRILVVRAIDVQNNEPFVLRYSHIE